MNRMDGIEFICDLFRHKQAAKTQDANTIGVEWDIVQGSIIQKAHDLSFPQVKGIVSENDVFSQKINDCNTINVDVLGLIRNI